MSNTKIDVVRIDHIVNKTIEAITQSKRELFDIAENARKECKRLEEELRDLKVKVLELISNVESLEYDLKDSKRKLLQVNKNFNSYSQEELKEAYERADTIRIALAVKREQELNLIRRRNELEIRIKDSFRAVEKADNLIANVGVALGYLTGDLMSLTGQLEDLQQKQMLGIRIIQAQEEERQRVAREVHDGPAQSMSNVVLRAEICEKLIDVDLDKAREELRNLKKIVRGTLQDVRRIIYDLRPMSLDDLGLVPTLQRYTATFQEDSGIKVILRSKAMEKEIKSVINLTTFRIIQEALSNIKKHAHAKNVSISLEIINSEIKLNIIDDGKGFDINSLKKRSDDINSGFGLMSMRERVQLLNGEFKLKSELEKGTVISISIPLTQEEEDKNGENKIVNSRRSSYDETGSKTNTGT